MKDRFKLFSMALCACAFAACNDNEGVDGPGDGDKSPVQYVVMSATSDGTANYLQLASDPTKGTIDPTEANGRISFDASNPDFVNYNNELLKYTWPGNVRELQHTIERAVILGDGSMLKPENFLFHTTSKQKKEEEVILNLEQLERQAIEKALRISNGNISRAAEYLGITRFALYRKLEKLGL